MKGEGWAISQVADRIDGKATAEIQTEQRHRYVIEAPAQLTREQWIQKYSPSPPIGTSTPSDESSRGRWSEGSVGCRTKVMKGECGFDRPNLDTLIYELRNVGLTIPHSSLTQPRTPAGLFPYGPSIDRRTGVGSIFCHDCRPKCADHGNGGSRHGRRCLAEQGGRVPGEGTCDQRSPTCSASSRAGAQLSQVC
jgi:hypothetical protein